MGSNFIKVDEFVKYIDEILTSECYFGCVFAGIYFGKTLPEIHIFC